MAQADHVFRAICASITGASGDLSTTTSVLVAHTELVAGLAGYAPRPITIGAIDIYRADHLNLGALSADAAAVLDDTAQNVPGKLDLPDVEAILADLAADMTGAIQHAAEDMAGWIA